MENLTNIIALQELVNSKYNGSVRKAAKDIGLSGSGLWRILKGERQISAETLKILNLYCIRNGLSIGDYIFLD